MSNKYSIYKLALFPEKIQSFLDDRITAPIYVRFKPTNRCNHACRWCVYHHGGGYGGQMHKDVDLRHQMPAERAMSLIEELAQIGVKAITFSGGGEPLAHPDFIEMAATARELGMATSAITNGQLLHGSTADVLADADWVRVSMDYWDEESFHASRQVSGKLFDEICENLRYFSKVRMGDLGVNFVVTRENQAHLVDVCMWLQDLGVDHVRFSPVWVDGFLAYHEPIRGFVESQLDYAAEYCQTESFRVCSSYRIDPGVAIRGFRKCWFQQITPVIGADLNVYACHNMAYSKAGLIGSVRDRPFGEVWYSGQTKAWFDRFDAKQCCNGIQCAAEAKNLWYNELVGMSGDAFV